MSGEFSEAFTQWGSPESWPEFQSMLQESDPRGRPRSSSLTEMKPIDVVMEEFKMNGFDSPYDPDEQGNIYSYRNNTDNLGAGLEGLAPPSTYVRQRSWPAPDASPTAPLPAPPARDYSAPSIEQIFAPSAPKVFAPSAPEVFAPSAPEVFAPSAPEVFAPGAPEIFAPSAPEVFTPKIPAYVEEPLPPLSEMLTEQQMRVLNSLPKAAVYMLLKELEQQGCGQRGYRRGREPDVIECRFCKNNGEKEQFYRSHRLRANGRVTCPVLRAYHCRRCGAWGDNAHTLKYCPFTTDDERMKSTNMMRSIRQGSNRRRSSMVPSSDLTGYYGGKNRNVMTDGVACNMYEPLDPTWEALAKKLLMS